MRLRRDYFGAKKTGVYGARTRNRNRINKGLDGLGKSL